MAALIVVTSVRVGSMTAAYSSGRLQFGVLGSTCDAARLPALRAAGVTIAEVPVGWDRFEPAPGVYDTEYLSWLRAAVDRCRDAGLQVVLSPGLHYAPAWVAQLPGGAYRDQDGNPGPPQVPNIIFSALVRQAVASYIRALDQVVPLNTFAAIRVGTSAAGEVGYPGREHLRNDTPDLWAFDGAAQKGQGLAGGMATSPMPGWTPGTLTWNGGPVGVDQVRQWFRWYTDSAARAVVWQIAVFRQQGYGGEIHVPLAGGGLLPAELSAAVDTHIAGVGSRDGSLDKGLFYPEQLALIAGMVRAGHQAGWGPVAADVTGLADATGRRARVQNPPQDTCRPGDSDRDLLSDPGVEQWSTFRWAVANARRAGLPVVGENPGARARDPNRATDADDLEEQMARAPGYALECGLDAMMWGFEDDLFDARSPVRIEDYAERIRATVGSS
jgi:hypothetical protein